MSTVTRPVGYVGALQQLIWNFPSCTAQVYLWGAGGGGGGDEGSDDLGGNGGGGAFARYNFTVNPGNVITVAVGQGGTGGTRTPGTVIGTGGRSLAYSVFDTRSQSDVVPVTNSAWSTFMNQHAVWDAGGPGVSPIFRSYNVNFPVTGYYVFQFAVDDVMTVQLDGSTIIDGVPGFTADPVPFVSQFVTAGNHTINITANNSGGGPAGVALTVDLSFSGANGGDGSGGSNGGGSGGGGGGATVLLRNDEVVAVAGGGAGGGGAGGNGATPGTSGPNAPGPWGWPALGTNTTLAQDGQGSNIGGGGGGGGGGQSAGNGGRRGGASPGNPSGAADRDGTAGSYGESVAGGDATENPSARTPGGSTNQYYSGSSRGGFGGSRWARSYGEPGQPGYAVFEFEISGLYVRDVGLWREVKNQYIRHEDLWQPIQNIYVRENNEWQQVYGTASPTFSTISGGFGQISRARGQN